MIKIGRGAQAKDNYKENKELTNQNEQSYINSEYKHRGKKINPKNEIKQMIALTALIRALKLKNFNSNDPNCSAKVEARSKRADSTTKVDEKFSEEQESYGTRLYQGRITSTTPAKHNALSEQRRQKVDTLKEQSVLNGGIIQSLTKYLIYKKYNLKPNTC